MIDLLDEAGVTAIAVKRKCAALFSDVVAVIGNGTCRVSVVAAAPGRWDAAEILSACCRARGARHFAVPECATITNPGGVDEHRVARLVAADGMRTHVALWHRRTTIGTPTVGFAAVLALDPERSTVALKALRTLEDLGFVTMSAGAGRRTAAWTAKAMMPKLRSAA